MSYPVPGPSGNHSFLPSLIHAPLAPETRQVDAELIREIAAKAAAVLG